MSKRTRVRIILIFVLLILAFIVVCYPDKVNVSGNIHNSAVEIETLVREDPVSFNSVLLYLKNKVMPISPGGFIEDLEISLGGPRTVNVKVNERDFAGRFLSGSTYWYFDRDGIVKAATKNEEEDYNTDNPVILITGIGAASVEIEDVMPRADTGLYGKIHSLTSALRGENIEVDEINIGEENITVKTGEVSVNLGDLSNMDQKIGKMKSILPETKGMSGILHLEEYDGSDEGIVFERN